MNKKSLISSKDIYRVGDIVKYEYVVGEYSTAKILKLNKTTVVIKIGLPSSKKNDIYEDVLIDIPYSKIIPFDVYMELLRK